MDNLMLIILCKLFKETSVMCHIALVGRDRCGNHCDLQSTRPVWNYL